MPDIDPDKIKGYEAILNMMMKFLLCLVSIIAFFIILYQLVTDPNPTNKGIYAATDFGILSGTMYVVMKHFFPSSQ